MPDHPSLTAPLVKVPPIHPVETMDPYKLCWCGSGTKYKWCHHRRHEQDEVNPFEVEARIVGELRVGYCSHPDPVGDPCVGTIVKAHTVQRRGGLSQIAEDSHVLTVKPTMKGLMADDGESQPRLLGIGKASVFPGFCSHHDDSLFKAVEGSDLPLDAEHAFLFGYRAIAYERFQKECQVRSAPHQREMDCGKPFFAQANVQIYLNTFQFGVRMGLADIERTKEAFDGMLMTGDRSGFHFLAVRFDGLLPMVGCAAFQVEQDLDGKQLQRLGHGTAPFEVITVTVTAFQGRTVAAFGWIDDGDGPAARLAASFAKLTDDRKADALLRLLFVHSDNLYLRPSWWDGLDEAVRDALVHDVMAGTPFRPRADGALKDDGRSLLTATVVETSNA
jgi:hypothetical protein